VTIGLIELIAHRLLSIF